MRKLRIKIFLNLILAAAPLLFVFAMPTPASAECSILSATFSPSGNKGENWFKDATPPNVKLTVVGNPDCVGKVAEVSIVEDDTAGIDDDVAGIDDFNVKFPVSSTFTINLKAGETDCEQWTGNDCEYFIKIDLTDAPNYSTEDRNNAGNLEYDCDDVCDEGWKVGSIERPGGDSKDNKPQDPACKSPQVLKDGKCVDMEYKLLSPLPCPPGSENCAGGTLDTYKFAQSQGISRYLNIMIRIFIGICAALAVIMIVIGGLEYMTSELISSKESGKQKITDAIFGLVLALGAWTILYQINPDLLKADIDNSVKDIKVSVTLEPEVGIGSTVIKTAAGRELKVCDPSQLTTISLFGHSAQVHKGVVSSLIRINAKWYGMPAAQRYKVSSVGSYNCREVTGKKGFWSAHAYGMALDINPATNPFGKVFKSDMPREFVKLFTDEGWGWGGNWKSVYDAMHFSKFPPAEGGNGVFEF